MKLMTGFMKSMVRWRISRNDLRSRLDPASIGLLVVVLILGPPAVHAEQPPIALTPPPFPIIAAASDAIMDVKLLPGDGSFELRNYTDYDIKTCFYYPDDNAMLIPLGIKGDKDNCYSTPAAGKKNYRTDSVGWSMFRKKPGYFHTLERHLNVKIFRKTVLGSYKKYCTKKGIFQPDQLRIQKDGKKSCRATVIRSYKPKYLRYQGITKGKDILRWTDAHSEDISYLVARNDEYVFVAVRGTSNYQNRKMNGELTAKEAKKKGHVTESRASARPVSRKGASVHFGWWKAAGKIYAQIEPLVETWAGKNGKKRKIIVTGHSMGGSVATYLSVMLMGDGYKNVHLVTSGAPRVTTKSFVGRFNELAKGRMLSASFVERAGDPRIDDWTSKMERVPTLTLLQPEDYDGFVVTYPSGCPDPHSRVDYHAKAKNPSYSCLVSGDEAVESPSRRRRIPSERRDRGGSRGRGSR